MRSLTTEAEPEDCQPEELAPQTFSNTKHAACYGLDRSVCWSDVFENSVTGAFRFEDTRFLSVGADIEDGRRGLSLTGNAQYRPRMENVAVDTSTTLDLHPDRAHQWDPALCGPASNFLVAPVHWRSFISPSGRPRLCPRHLLVIDFLCDFLVVDVLVVIRGFIVRRGASRPRIEAWPSCAT